MPKKTYGSEAGDGSTSRFFIDKFPIFVRPARPSDRTELAVFTFVDEGLVGVSKFENYLRTYRTLFEALADFEVIYVAATVVHSERARAVFERVFTHGGTSSATSSGFPIDQLIEYFRLRKRYDERAFGTFDRAELIRLRDARARFSGAEHEVLFAQWLTSGDAAVARPSNGNRCATATFRGTSSTYHLRHDYTFLGGYELR